MARSFGALLALLLAAPAAAGEDLAPKQLEAVRAAAERVRKELAAGGLRAVAVWEIDLDALAPQELARAPDTVDGLPDDVRAALARACRTAALRRGPLGRLEKARDICFLLASPEDGDWLDAYRLLRREPLGEDLDRAVLLLGADERPELRAAAARLATALLVFGRKSKGLADTVIACIADRDPSVAAACALAQPENTGDKRVIDRMVERLDDDRPVAARASPLLAAAGWESVGHYFRDRLCWTVFLERRARCKFLPTLDRTGEPEYADLPPDDIRRWWRENREAFGFLAPAPHWRCVFDDVVVLDIGKRAEVLAAGGMPLRIDLRTYREDWRGGLPVTTIDGEIHSEVLSERADVATLGPEQMDACVSDQRGTWSDGTVFSEIFCRTAFLPTHEPRRVRMRLLVHIGHEGD